MGDLRPYVLAALSDPDASVRRDAVMALASMDFDGEHRELTLSKETASDLAALYRRESEGYVRGEIAKSFALGREDYPELRLVLLDALADPDSHVRQHALMGAERLQLQAALPKVVEALRDPDAHTRFLAAHAISTYGASLENLEALVLALAAETDRIARGEIERAIAKASERRARAPGR